jgi:hypothetical protein
MSRAKAIPAEESKPKAAKPKTATSKTSAKPAPKPAPKKPATKKTATKTAAASKPRAAKASRPILSGEERQRMIAVAAYFRAEKRGFHPGYEDEDWCVAEAEIDALLGKA